jgi:hypothetical protein
LKLTYAKTLATKTEGKKQPWAKDGESAVGDGSGAAREADGNGEGAAGESGGDFEG